MLRRHSWSTPQVLLYIFPQQSVTVSLIFWKIVVRTLFKRSSIGSSGGGRDLQTRSNSAWNIAAFCFLLRALMTELSTDLVLSDDQIHM
jgi:hypothetical protein